ALRETIRYLDATIAAPAKLDRSRLKAPFALVQQHELPFAAVDHRAAGNRQHRALRARRDFDVGIHIGSQQLIGVRQLDAYPGGPRLRVHMRVDQRDLAVENAIGIGARSHRCFLPDRYQRQVTFGDIGYYPYDLMIGDAEQNRTGCGPHAVDGSTFQDLSILRGKPWHRKSHLAGALDLGDSLFRYSEIFQ